jgi:hypothetical protein
MRRRLPMYPYEPLDEDEKYEPLDSDEKLALWLLVTGHTRQKIAEIFNEKLKYTRRKSLRTLDDACAKLHASNQKKAIAKALLLGVVPPEDVARYYGIPMHQFTAERRLSGAVNTSLLPEVDVGNPEEVNSWLAKEVVLRTPAASQMDPDTLYTSFSKVLSTARAHPITHSPHPLAFKVHPCNGFIQVSQMHSTGH